MDFTVTLGYFSALNLYNQIGNYCPLVIWFLQDFLTFFIIFHLFWCSYALPMKDWIYFLTSMEHYYLTDPLRKDTYLKILPSWYSSPMVFTNFNNTCSIYNMSLYYITISLSSVCMIMSVLLKWLFIATHCTFMISRDLTFVHLREGVGYECDTLLSFFWVELSPK